MIRTLVVSAALLGSVLSTLPAQAQGLTRAQVQMDRDSFLATHRWDEQHSQWVLRDGMPMPQGIKSRAEVMAMTTEFLKMHRWDEARSEWVPTGGKPRDMSTLTREQVQMETLQFLRTHRFDESSGEWVSKQRGG